jgi:ABC-type transport system substrate-binding protein
MKMKRLIKQLSGYLFVLAVACTFVAAFAIPVQAETPQYGGVFKYNCHIQPSFLGWPSDCFGLQIFHTFPCLETLVSMDEKGRPIPHLAEGWKYSPDYKSLTLFLKKGVKFHDGADFNAEAVKANLEERMANRRGSILASIKSIDTIDEYTVRLNLKKYNNALIESFVFHEGVMISPEMIKKGKDYAKDRPVGTGPFKFVKFERDVILKYEKFDGYWDKGKPYLDGLEVHFIRNPVTSMTSLLAGESHAMLIVPEKDAIAAKKKGFYIASYPSAMFGFAPDSSNPESVLADKRVRQAIDYAINKKAVTDSMGYGFWDPAYQYCSKTGDAYNHGLKERSYDPEKARQLLKEAGYPNGFKISIYTTRTFTGASGMEAVQRDLKKVGIEVKLDLVDRGKYNQLQFGGWKNGLLFFGHSAASKFTYGLSTTFAVGARRVRSIMRDPGLSDILDKATSTPDPKEKNELTQKVVRMIHDDAVVIPLIVNDQIAVIHNSVHDTGISERNSSVWTPANVWISK